MFWKPYYHVRRFVYEKAEPERDWLLNQRTILVISLLSLVSFLLIILFKDSFTTIDSGVNLWAATIHTGYLTVVAVIVAYLFDTTVLLVASLLAAVYLFYKRHWKYSVLLLSGMGGDAALVLMAKTLIHSARPLNGILYDAGFSFPSGHVAGSLVFCGMLAYFAWRRWKSAEAKLSSSIPFIVITSVVGFDRVYLGVHWFSDVLGGFLLGIFWLTFCLLLFQHLEVIKKLRQTPSGRKQRFKHTLQLEFHPSEKSNNGNFGLLGYPCGLFFYATFLSLSSVFNILPLSYGEDAVKPDLMVSSKRGRVHQCSPNKSLWVPPLRPKE
jgi:membrane-associated phospholipid phosphatase